MDTATDAAKLDVDFHFGFGERVRSGLVMIVQRPLALLSALFPALVGLSLLLLILYRERPFRTFDIILIALSLLYLPLAILFRAWQGHRATRARQHLCRYEFGDFGVRTKSETSEWVQSWKAILKVKKQGGFLLLFFTRDCAHCLPYAQLESANLVAPLVDLARAHDVPVHGV